MKFLKILLLTLLFGAISVNIVYANEDLDIYNKSVEDKEKKIDSAVLTSETNHVSNHQNITSSLTNYLINYQKNTYNKDILRGLQSYAYGSNIILNGHFEAGHANWSEYYRSSFDDLWYDYDHIISSYPDCYNHWCAYISSRDWLFSNYAKIPANTVDFLVTYNYRFMYWDSCSYGLNNIAVFLNDKTADEFHIINLHVPNYDEYNYDYTSAVFLTSEVSDFTPIPNHDININFLHIKEDPNCRFALYLDNVSVEPIIYVPDYYINTSSDPNGSITHGSTIPQGSNIDIYITPNSGYEILDVVVDGISVGPVKYYSFKNIQSNHDVYATFQVENNTSQKIYRFWGARGGHHFYTANDDEFTYVVNNYPNDVWQYEGVGYRSFLTQQAETIPVYRFWSDQSLGHFYTASEEEKNYIIANYPTRVWKFEGIAYKVP